MNEAGPQAMLGEGQPRLVAPYDVGTRGARPLAPHLVAVVSGHEHPPREVRLGAPKVHILAFCVRGEERHLRSRGSVRGAPSVAGQTPEPHAQGPGDRLTAVGSAATRRLERDRFLK